MAVLKEVKLFEVFENQGGLKFQLNEGAKNLSGGQRQRLALARALLRESDVYILMKQRIMLIVKVKRLF